MSTAERNQALVKILLLKQAATHRKLSFQRKESDFSKEFKNDLKSFFTSSI